MIQAIPPTADQSIEALFCPSVKNPAVALCTEVWQEIHAATLKHTTNLYTAKNCAGKAYRWAMPPLSGYQNICDFIACTAYGMLLGAIKSENGTKLLYAAQVALAAVPKESKILTRTESHPSPDPHPSPTFAATTANEKG